MLVGGIISQIKASYQATTSSPAGGFPNFLWWTVAYVLLVVIGIIGATASATTEVYQNAIVGFLAIAFVYTTSAVSSLVYQNGHEEQACAAGFILISIIFVRLPRVRLACPC